MKLVNEELEDVLKPKSEKEVKKSIKTAVEREPLNYYIFIDEGYYDVDFADEDPDDSEYEEYLEDYLGMSELPIYGYPGTINPDEQDEVDNFSDHRDEFPEIGMATVLFDMDNEPSIEDINLKPSASKKYKIPLIHELLPSEITILFPSL